MRDCTQLAKSLVCIGTLAFCSGCGGQSASTGHGVTASEAKSKQREATEERLVLRVYTTDEGAHHLDGSYTLENPTSEQLADAIADQPYDDEERRGNISLTHILPDGSAARAGMSENLEAHPGEMAIWWALKTGAYEMPLGTPVETGAEILEAFRASDYDALTEFAEQATKLE